MEKLFKRQNLAKLPKLSIKEAFEGQEFREIFSQEWTQLIDAREESSFLINVNDFYFTWAKSSADWDHPILALGRFESQENPIFFNFEESIRLLQKQFQSHGLRRQLLYKIFSPPADVIVDLTAGCLNDSIQLLAMGFKVIAFEQNPILCLLILNAMKRWSIKDQFTFYPIASSKLEVKKLCLNSKSFDLYFDPMFEDVDEKSNVKKQMSFLRILNDQTHRFTSHLWSFEELSSCQARKLVVKRSHHSQLLFEEKLPIGQYFGKSIRFDLY